MAGKSSRFKDAGYNQPKYKLPLGSKTVFDWVVLSFEKYFFTHHFKFIVQESFEIDNFTEEHIKKLGITNFSIFSLKENTRGQAETVYNAIIDEIYDEDILIFNIDTIRKNFTMHKLEFNSVGFLEIFKGDGDHWSFIEPFENGSKFVKRTTEKERISNLCSNGMYYFKSIFQLRSLCKEAIVNNNFTKGELYIAPLYNQLIQSEFKVEYIETNIEDNIFCGTPQEYEKLKMNNYFIISE